MERLKVMQDLKEEGFFVGINLMPVLPYLSDSEEDLNIMVKEFKDHGASHVLVSGLTLYGDKSEHCKTRYLEILKDYKPEILDDTKKLFNNSFAPQNYQLTLHRKIKRVCEEYGLKNSII